MTNETVLTKEEIQNFGFDFSDLSPLDRLRASHEALRAALEKAEAERDEARGMAFASHHPFCNMRTEGIGGRGCICRRTHKQEWNELTFRLVEMRGAVLEEAAKVADGLANDCFAWSLTVKGQMCQAVAESIRALSKDSPDDK